MTLGNNATRFRVAETTFDADGLSEPRRIVSLIGDTVDVSGTTWVIHDPTKPITLEWNDISWASLRLYAMTRSYFRWLIARYSTAHVSGNWYGLRYILNTPALVEACRAGQIIPLDAFRQAFSRTDAEQRYRLTYVRYWYGWCAEFDDTLFSTEIALQLERFIIGGNRKGHNVRSMNPKVGPLTHGEVVALEAALGAARTQKTLSLREQCAVWLCLSLGANTGQLARIPEDGFRRLDSVGTAGVLFEIDVPRHKKQTEPGIDEVRTRRLRSHAAEIVEALIQENRRKAKPDEDAAYERPLFRRRGRRLDESEHLRHLGFYHASMEMGQIIQAAVAKLRVISPRTGKPLRASARRFRYTFASRLVQEGASQRAVADALDHSDLQQVQVYFDIASGIVEHLDDALGEAVRPLTEAFLGKLVRHEGDAIRGHDKGSRVYLANRSTNTFAPIGTCGTTAACGLTAPLACYTCVRFQPWVEAPHGKVLAFLEGQQARARDQGLAEHMILIYAPAITAVKEVMALCNEAMAQQAGNGA